MIEMKLEDVFVRVAEDEPPRVSRSRVILLREADGERLLPIWVGAPEGDALALRLTGETTPRRLPGVLRDNGIVQMEVGVCEARLTAARACILSEIDEIWTTVKATNQLTVPQRMRIRLMTTHGIHEAKAVGDAVYDLAGATAKQRDIAGIEQFDEHVRAAVLGQQFPEEQIAQDRACIGLLA